ncbi:MAG: hypothetical protein KIH01_01740 [Candidatus Freyarchaeota archaeon]|nr:hypothetical protein [Candidatus Jordarchaeia archaeon]
MAAMLRRHFKGKLFIVSSKHVFSSRVYQELVEDLIAVISGFAGRLYGLRIHNEKVVEVVRKLVVD